MKANARRHGPPSKQLSLAHRLFRLGCDLLAFNVSIFIAPEFVVVRVRAASA
jgi:hypothetical protein